MFSDPFCKYCSLKDDVCNSWFHLPNTLFSLLLLFDIDLNEQNNIAKHKNAKYIVHPLSLIFKKCVDMGKLHCEWKHSNKTALYKNGDKKYAELKKCGITIVAL